MESYNSIIRSSLDKNQNIYMFVTGKYASGKSTVTKKIQSDYQDYGVAIIELDKIVREHVQINMSQSEIATGKAFQVYTGETESSNILKFIEGVKYEISNAHELGNKIIILEGALSNEIICKEIVGEENLIILYFQPINHELHKERIISRIVTDIEQDTYTLPKYWGSKGKLCRDTLISAFESKNYQEKRCIVQELYSEKLDEIVEQCLIDAQVRAVETISKFSVNCWSVSIIYT